MKSNYERNIFNQLQETILLVEKLGTEISELKREHKDENELLNSTISALTTENTALKAENQKLKDIINKNSGNSSKPPSSDGFKKIHNSREKTGQKIGGQKGHKGHTPTLFENPTTIIEHKQKKCHCGGQVKYSDSFKAKQFVDVEVVTNIVEHRAYSGVCECCNAHISNDLPINDVITYGDNLKSFSAMLSFEGLVSINRIKQMLSELTGGKINLSEGTIAKWNKDLSHKLAPAIEKIWGKLLVSPVLHKDETGIRINKKMNWLHVLSNEAATLYFSDIKRGNVADEKVGILPFYSGILMHDHLKALYKFLCKHAECNAHILRYLKAVVENKERIWAKNMIEFLVGANNSIKALKSDGIESLSEAESNDYFDKYDEILENGKSEFLKDKKPDYNGADMKLLRRLIKYKPEHLRFTTNFAVPFDNNAAERDLRMIKAKTKISGCFRGEHGGEIFAIVKSYTSTLRKNNSNIFNGIKLAFVGNPVLC